MVVASLQVWIFLLLHLVVFVVAGWSLVDALVRPAAAFTWAGKRTRPFWLAVTGGATALAFVAIPPPVGIGLLGGFGFLLVLGAAVAGGVYLADVRPAVRQYRGPRGSRGAGGSDGPGSRGGW